MSKEEDNKAVVGRWFTEFWGKSVNLGVVDEIAAPDMLLKYSLHEPRRGRDDIKAFMTDFRAAFPDLNFWGTADLIAEGDYVVGQWEGGGTHTGPAFNDFLIGGLPAATGRKMHFTGTTVLKVIDCKIVEEIGLDDAVTALNVSHCFARGQRGEGKQIERLFFAPALQVDKVDRPRLKFPFVADLHIFVVIVPGSQQVHVVGGVAYLDVATPGRAAIIFQLNYVIVNVGPRPN